MAEEALSDAARGARPFDLVIFDCDGVLIDSEIISARMLVAELDRMGVGIDLAYVAQHFLGRSYPTVMNVIRKDFGVDLPPEFEDAYRARLLAAFEEGLRVMPGAGEVLDGTGVPWCVATSSSRKRAERSLEIAGLRDRVGERLFTAADVAQGKPAPDLFLHAAGRMGVAPGSCLVVEDSLNGIRAARAAGMEVWWFTGGSHLAGLPLPDVGTDRPGAVFTRLADFLQMAPHLATGYAASR
jgi:HAD superfamily hydrolase (TIGR01509 family)